MHVRYWICIFLNWKPLILLLSFLAVLAWGGAVASAQTDEVSSSSPVMAVSPEDGSLWMAAPGDGLYRLGRNGRILHYSVGSGHLKNDTIVSLAFDASATLYILDAAGQLTRYSSVEGFSSVPSIDGGIGSLSESAGIPYIIKDSLLYSLSGDAPELVRTLPFSISTPSLPEFEYETEPAAESEPSEEDKKGSALSSILWIALGLFLGLLIGFLLFRRQSKEEKVVEAPALKVTPVVQKVEPVVQKEETPVVQAAPVQKEEVPAAKEESAPLGIEEALKASEFGQKVWDLVIANLSNPAYGVEQVAADLEISRIHVNRKLKAQTGYSPSAVFKFIRMNHASRLLLEGKLTIADVARECGFASASYFSTAFKDYYKQSPSEYVAGKSPVSGTLDL